MDHGDAGRGIPLQVGWVDLQTGALRRHDGGVEHLTTKEVELLTYLAERPNQTVSRDALLAEVWRYHPDALSRAADYAVRRLRKKIEEDPAAPVHLLTAFGDGYRFVPLTISEEVEVGIGAPADPGIPVGAGRVFLERMQLIKGDGATEELSATDVALMRCFLRHDGVPVARSQLLKDVWGRSGGMHTRAVDNAVMRLRARIERDATSPQHLTTVRGTGYRFVLSPDGPTEAGAALPEPVRLIGRGGDLGELRALSGVHRLVTVVGPGGVGKTALALAFAAGAAPGVLYCDGSAAMDLDGLLKATLAAARISLPPGVAGVDAIPIIGAQLSARPPGILVLDNFEQLIPLAHETVGAWLAAAPTWRFVVTSRAPLGLAAERVLGLGPLDPAAAVELFRARSGVGESRALFQLVEHLDRLPLAIELAAARCALLSPGQLLERLDARFKLLRAPTRGAEGRHSSLYRTLEWSWSLLDDEAKAALAQLSVFVGGFSIEAVEEIVECEDWVLDVLSRLRDASMVALDVGAPGTGPRYRLLESIRAFAAERLRAEGDAPAALLRHARYFAQEAERMAGDLFCVGSKETFDRLFAELDNVVAAFDRTVDTHTEVAATLLLAVGAALLRCGMLDTLTHRTAALEAALPQEALVLRARVRVGQAYLRWSQGDPAGAVALLDEGSALLPEGASEAVATRIHYARGMFLLQQGAVDGARPHLERAIECARVGGAEDVLLAVSGYLGVIYVEEGDLDRGTVAFEEALHVSEARGYTYLICFFSAALADVDLERGRYRSAIHRLDRALTQGVAGRERSSANWQAHRGVALWMEGQEGDGEAAITAALGHLCEGGVSDDLARIQGHYGRLLLLNGRAGEAEGLLRQAADGLHRDGERAVTTAFIAACLRRLGRPEEAASHLAEARRLAAGAPPPCFEDLLAILDGGAPAGAGESLALRQAQRISGSPPPLSR